MTIAVGQEPIVLAHHQTRVSMYKGPCILLLFFARIAIHGVVLFGPVLIQKGMV